MGNRCGHDRTKLRLCDIVKRGKGGAPPILGIVSGYLNDAAKSRKRLKSWHQLNASGRGRRSEAREAMATVLQFLISEWFQLETRRCARPGFEYLEVPDVRHIALKISLSKDWKGTRRMTVGRVQAVIHDLVELGYITRSKQIRKQQPTGEWIAAPKITTFTKKFFLELDGRRLWNTIKKYGERKIRNIEKYLDDVNFRPFWPTARRLAHYLNPGHVYSPRQAYHFKQEKPPDLPMDLSTFPEFNFQN
ncbi:MAG: hypothetical protein COA96_14125 [SAR86 cluster bacterium]|uniref:Uncharacterized protein n=1 Tax=SAR86 cluster bacterium TaxID=2030880 RepID=A0A2A5ATE4_9GAMM|nr:MAG: hypothetical protein COA96_14125 [SAR86 cluster bacterium]